MLFLGALFLFIVAGVFHLLVMLFVRRSNAGFEATFKASAYATAVSLVILIWMFVGFLLIFYASAVSLVPWITVVGYLLIFYGLYLTVVGIRELHSTTTARAAAVVLIPASVALLADLALTLSEGGVDLLLERVTPPAVVAGVIVLVVLAYLVLFRGGSRS